jgi:hypothetical protein
MCACWVLQVEANPDLSPKKWHLHHLPSAKAGCKAQIYLCKICDADPATALEVEFQWEHCGHKPGTLQDMRQLNLSAGAKKWLHDLIINHNMDYKQIKNLLWLDKSILDALKSGGSITSVPESLLISDNHIYNHIRKRLLEAVCLDKDGFCSLELWQEKLVAADYNMYYKKVSAAHN